MIKTWCWLVWQLQYAAAETPFHWVLGDHVLLCFFVMSSLAIGNGQCVHGGGTLQGLLKPVKLPQTHMLRFVHNKLHPTLTCRAGSDDDDDDDDMDEDDADTLPDDPYHLPINHEVTLQVSRKAQLHGGAVPAVEIITPVQLPYVLHHMHWLYHGTLLVGQCCLAGDLLCGVL